MRRTIYVLTLVLSIMGCKEKENQLEEVIADETEVENNSEEETKIKKTSTFQLLQGTWINAEDTRSSLLFEDSRVKNRYDGIGNDANILFSVGDTCLNGRNKEGSEEEDKYISTTGDATECYYIIQLDQDNLVMSFVSQGHTLTFKRE